MMKKILLFLLLVSGFCNAQIYTMQNGTFSVSTGTFYDSGGPTGNYMANENYQITFCPATPGTYVQLDFNAYNTEAAPRDIFTIYEGSDIDGEVIGVYGAVSPMSCLGGLITSSDPNGCLTITFQSDNGGQYFGWAAAISLSTVPGVNEDLPLNSFCTSGTKFCADTSVPFPNVTSNDCVPTSAGVVTENTCLLEAPNPVWHTIKIEQDGNLQLRIKQTTGPSGTGSQIDVDFALWGPYTDENAACGNLTPGNCTGDHNCSGNVVDCSFSLAGQETATITNAHAGEYYLLLVTNYEGAAGYISMQQLNASAPGAGTTDCTIVCPQAAKTNPTKCGVADGYITLSGFRRNTFYNITYSYNGNPVAVTLRSTTLGKIILSGLKPGTYTNILTNYDDCTTPIGPIVLTEALPVLTSITAPSLICNDATATYTLTGTPNAVVTYSITGEPLPQSITLDASGTNTVVVNNITTATTLQATTIATGNTAVTGFAQSVSGGENPLTATGNIAAVGTIPTSLNAASINGTNATMVVSLQHTIPAGTAITISLAKNISYGEINITDGSANLVFNSGPIDVLQRITFTTAVETNKLILTRINGSVWIDGVRYTYNPGLCTATINVAKTVTVRPIITAPTVTTPVIYCRDATSVALTATPLTAATLNWYLTNTPGETPSATAPTPATNIPGDFTFYVSQTLNGCESVRSAIVVQVNFAAIAPTVAAAPVQYCLNQAAVPLTATASAGAQLHWYATNAPGAIELASAPIPSTAIAGDQFFYVSQTLSDCESLKVPIRVIVNDIPAGPIVATPVRYCIAATAQLLTATPLAGATLNWYAADGTLLSGTPLPDTSIANTTNYFVSQTLGNCESNRIRIQVQVGLPAAAPVVNSPVDYCQFSEAIALTATVSAGGTLNWYTHATTGTAEDEMIPSTEFSGSFSYYVSQTINGCESSRSEVVVNIKPAPARPTVPAALSFCQNEITGSLTATATTGATLNWYGTNQTGGTATATVPTISANSAIYYVSQTLNGCESLRAAIPVTIKPIPVAPIVNPVVYCEGDRALPLQAQAVSGGILNWYGTNQTGGIRSATAPIPNTNLSANYYVSQTVDGCESPRALILVQVKPKPNAPLTSPVSYCNGELATALTAVASAGGTLKWYLTNNLSDAALPAAPVPITTNSGNQTYFVSQIVNGCESLRAPLLVTVGMTAAPMVISPIRYCQNENPSPLSAIALPGAVLNWYTQIGGNASASAPVPSTATVTPQTYYVSQTINGCESIKIPIQVIINPLPQPQLSNGIICIRESNLTVEKTHRLNTGLSDLTHQFVWTLNGQILDHTTAILEADTAGTYEVVATNRVTNCSSLPVQAVVEASFVGESIVISDQEAFADSQNITVQVTGRGDYEYQLDYGPFQSSNVFTNVSSGAHTIHVRDENDCTNLSHTFSIIGYLRFFTPNGDGFNDVWSIPGIENDPSAKITIFDRYGKLMKVINIKDNSWNGTYAGKDLPADDYWFLMEYTEKEQRKEFRSHFSLKR